MGLCPPGDDDQLATAINGFNVLQNIGMRQTLENHCLCERIRNLCRMLHGIHLANKCFDPKGNTVGALGFDQSRRMAPGVKGGDCMKPRGQFQSDLVTKF